MQEMKKLGSVVPKKMERVRAFIKKNRWLYGWLLKTAELSPVAAPAALASFSAVAMFFLVINQFRSLYIWPLGLLAAAITTLIVAKSASKVERPGTKREQRICDLLVVGGVLLWTIFNGLYTAQQIYVNRDPAIYNDTGVWLIHHNNLHIPKSNVFGQIAGVHANSAGFGFSLKNSNELFAGGVHLLPALMGLVGRIVGVGPMLHLNVLFGAVALLALYGFTRLLARPRWAVVTTTTFALSLPLIYFSRGDYTEPLAAALVFSALTLLWVAQKTKRNSLWILAGIAAGAGVLARIDAYLTLSALLASVVIMLALAEKTERKRLLISSALMTVSAAVVTLIGWLDLTLLSSGYYKSEFRHIGPEFMLLAAIGALGAVGIVVCWKTKIVGYLDRKTRNWRAPLIATGIIIGAAFLATRPLWQKVYGRDLQGTATGFQTVIVRSYTEFSLHWVAWYLGPLLVVMGFVGLALAAYRVMKQRDAWLLMPALLVVLLTSALYYLRPNIHPDQIWASRRFLPVIMPGLAAFGALGLQWLYGLKSKWLLGIKGKTLATVIATMCVVGPLFIVYPFLFTRSYVPELRQVEMICSDLPSNAAVLWFGEPSLRAVQPTRAFCDVPSMGYGMQVTKSFLAQIAKNALAHGYTPVVGIFGYQRYIIPPSDISELTDISTIHYTDLEQGRRGPPRNLGNATISVLLGRVLPDGSIVPLAIRSR